MKTAKTKVIEFPNTRRWKLENHVEGLTKAFEDITDAGSRIGGPNLIDRLTVELMRLVMMASLCGQEQSKT